MTVEEVIGTLFQTVKTEYLFISFYLCHNFRSNKVELV